MLNPSRPGQPALQRPQPGTLFKRRTAPLAATSKAEQQARVVAVAFTSALAGHGALAKAYADLDPQLAARSSYADWQAGRSLPVALARSDRYSSFSVAFADETDVGIVLTFQPAGAGAVEKLVALRLLKSRGARWLVDYVHQGHSSAFVDEANFAPGGFYPGSTPMSTSSWLPLVLALLLLVCVAVLVERRLGPG